jgi:hypothetical protein
VLPRARHGCDRCGGGMGGWLAAGQLYSSHSWGLLIWGSRGLSACPQVGSSTRGPMPQATGRSQDVSGGCPCGGRLPWSSVWAIGRRYLKVPRCAAGLFGARRRVCGGFWHAVGGGWPPDASHCPSGGGDTYRRPGLARGFHHVPAG